MKNNKIKAGMLNTLKIATLSLLIFSCKEEEATPASVTVFEDSNFSGLSKSFDIGEFFVTKGSFDPVGNDKITSIKIPSTLKCTVCDNDNGVGGNFGTCITLTEDVVDFTSKSFNDKTSYIKVEKR
jgi:hypothetical protein